MFWYSTKDMIVDSSGMWQDRVWTSTGSSFVVRAYYVKGLSYIAATLLQ
jgi:hypothetical protein